jgi:hypothetical protein
MAQPNQQVRDLCAIGFRRIELKHGANQPPRTPTLLCEPPGIKILFF